jgi:hypothetical protein
MPPRLLRTEESVVDDPSRYIAPVIPSGDLIVQTKSTKQGFKPPEFEYMIKLLTSIWRELDSTTWMYLKSYRHFLNCKSTLIINNDHT